MATLTQEIPLPWAVVKGAIPTDFSKGITFSLKVPNRQVICLHSLQKVHTALKFLLWVAYLKSKLRCIFQPRS